MDFQARMGWHEMKNRSNLQVLRPVRAHASHICIYESLTARRLLCEESLDTFEEETCAEAIEDTQFDE